MSVNKDVKSNIKSADDLIIQDEAAKLGKVIPKVPNDEPKIQLEAEGEQSQPKTESAAVEETPTEKSEEKNSEPTEQPPQEEAQIEAPEASKDEEVDEYGTKVGKKKLYTEEEVQQMMRDRLKRGRHSQEQNQEIQQAAKEFKPDQASEESWEAQLEKFIDNHIENKTKQAQQLQWKAREEQTQAEFEIKFTQGMDKYADFQAVVGQKPITNAMMLATRSMKDPAAFIYAACKHQPKELARIAEIPDAVTQATEIGRLEERMKKARAIPQSPTPAKRISGDKSDTMPQLDIDARIAQHAKTKIMR